MTSYSHLEHLNLMILFEKIRWKNFLSTGNQYIELDFQEKSTVLISGNNGAGKSTVLDALTLCCFLSHIVRSIDHSYLILLMRKIVELRWSFL